MPYKGYGTYYEVFGKPGSKQTPLLVLHGGPGSAHNYLLGLAELARDRQVIFYDQIGGGMSGRPLDNSVWSFEYFLDELKEVRNFLKLSELHLLGHSWGGMLAIEYLLGKPVGIKSAILASTIVSIPLYQSEVEKLKKDLPGKTYSLMRKHELAGTTNSEEYTKAMKLYNERHIYRGSSFPVKYSDPPGTFGKIQYETLWGVSEAYANGSLKSWDRIKQLNEIKLPVLITSGQYDEVTPNQATITKDNVFGSQIKIFTAGSHLTHVEFPAEYIDTISEFLQKVDTQTL